MARSVPAGVQVFDLGELWYRFTGLPVNIVKAEVVFRTSGTTGSVRGVVRLLEQLEVALAPLPDAAD